MIFNFTIGFTPIPNETKRFDRKVVINDINKVLMEQQFIPILYTSKPQQVFTEESPIPASEFCGVVFFIKFTKEYKT